MAPQFGFTGIKIRDYLTKDAALLRQHKVLPPIVENVVAPAIDRFFADAGDNSVRAFFSEITGWAGYIFFQPLSEATFRYHAFVIRCKPDLLPGDVLTRFKNQFTTFEWFTGSFQGKVDTISASGMDLTEEEPS